MKYVLLLVMPIAFSCTQSMKAKTDSAGTLAKPTVTMTASFKSLADLPRCDEGSDKMNAFISERDSFVQCRNFFWRNVKPGDTSGSYLAREPVRYNEWIDTSTRRRWSLPKQDEIQLTAVKASVCSPGWALPTRSELLEASINGLFEGLKSRGGVAFDKAWTANLDAIVGVSEGNFKSIMPSGNDDTKAGVYCVASFN